MTTEEAIVVLQKIKPIPHRGDGKSITHILEIIAIDMAIKALEQQPCEDCISREAVLDIVNNPLNIRLDEVIKKLPSVTPKFTDAEIQKMQEMEQAQLDRAYELGKAEIRPCEDCISRQEVISAIQDEYYADAVGIDIVDIIAHLPSVTPKAESKNVLAEIKAEIEQHCCITVGSEDEPAITLYDVFKIIDKYKAESEEEK